MQILAHNPEIQSYSNEEGHFITGFLIGTKPNEAKWQISKRTGHNLVQKFIGKDFAIIPQLINTPLSQGGGGHYFGQDTKEDLLKGYAENSHGKYTRVKGPYSYNDGSDDYYYNFDIKLRDSKAAAILLEHGAKTWVPYSHSPHIWPLAGPDEDIYDWEPIGGALVIKGAYGPQAVISKLCKGTSAQCEKSLGASAKEKLKDAFSDAIFTTLPYEESDKQSAEIISSLVSKTASTQSYMTDDKQATTPQITTLTAEVAKPNATVDSQTLITNASLTKVVTAEEFAASEKEKAELKKQVTLLLNDKKQTSLNTLFEGHDDDKVKKEVLEKWFKKEAIDIDILKEFAADYEPVLKARLKKLSEQEPEDKDKEDPKGKQKGKAASLPKEPELPKEETESKTASVPVNKLQEILRFQISGGRA